VVALNSLKIQMPSKNQIIAEAFQSIREFLNIHQTQLNVLKERTECLELEQMRLDELEKRIDNLQGQQQIRIDVLEKRVDKQEQQEKRLDILEKSVDILEQILNEGENRLGFVEQTLDRLRVLETQFYNTEYQTHKIAKSLPHAIYQANLVLESPTSSSAGTELAKSLQMPVELCIKQSISQDPRPFADTLFPVMGPAIRKAISDTFKNLLQSINQAADLSLSPQGLAWRLEARRKGIPFSEIVLQNTLVFRVEQVFLIHRDSGLLIQHRHQEDVEIGDSDAISAMLTAIQDFIRDSFSKEGTEELDSVEIGDYTVWLERGPYAVLACVIRGVAPYEFRENIRTSLETMHAHYGVLLQQFAGDNNRLQPCLPLLEKTLQSESKPEAQKKQQRLLSPPLIVILGVILLATLGWGYRHFQYQQRLSGYIDALQNAPGIVVISSQRQDGKLFIYGMRDPLAEKPQEIAQGFDLSDEEVEIFWTAYHDLSPQFVEQRVRQRLAPPSTVSVRLQDEVLYLSGHALPEWIDKAGVSGIAPGIERLVMDELLETDQFLLALAVRELGQPDNVTLTVQKRVLLVMGGVNTKTYEALQQRILDLPISDEAFASFDTNGLINIERERNVVIEEIEKTKLYFSSKSAKFVTGQETALDALLEAVQQLLLLSEGLRQSVHLQIIGNTDGRSSKIYNQQLGQRRAEKVLNWLHSQGIDKDKLIITPPAVIRFGGSEPNSSNRNVIFKVQVEE
jgi:outer membrane protein OmpA-like peptidoglycan-associated protein